MSDVERQSQESAVLAEVTLIQQWRRRYADGDLFENPNKTRRATFALLRVLEGVIGADDQDKISYLLKRSRRVRKMFAVTGDLQVVNGYFAEVLAVLGVGGFKSLSRFSTSETDIDD